MAKSFLDDIAVDAVQTLYDTSRLEDGVGAYLNKDADLFLQIKHDIAQERDKLQKPQAGINGPKQARAHKPSIGMKLRLWDSRMQGVGVYRSLRPVLKKLASPILLIRRRPPDPLAKILKLNENEFVDALYQMLLNREPDFDGKSNVLFDLQCGVSRIQCAWTLANSDEAKACSVHVPSLKRRYALERIKLAPLKIPVLGHIIKWIYAIVTLPALMGRFNAQKAELWRVRHQIEQERVAAERERVAAEQERIERETTMDNFYSYYKSYFFGESSHASMYSNYAEYLPILEKLNKSSARIADLGSGDGEWIGFLHEHGFKGAYGVDSNPLIVRKANERNLKTVECDAIGYLKALPPNSLEAITSFHMVEHIEPVAILQLFGYAYRALVPGGLLIVETPNPENLLTSTEMFHMDLTHKSPIPHDLLSFIAKYSGFGQCKLLRLNSRDYISYDLQPNDPLSDVIYRFNMEQAYAIVAVKQ